MDIRVKDLNVSFSTPQGQRSAVRNVSFSMTREKLAIVGESGSGKSLTARALLKLLPPKARLSAEELRLADVDVLRASEAEMAKIRGRGAGLILQDPKFSLNAVMTAGDQIAETYRTHCGGNWKHARAIAVDLLAQVQIRDPRRVADAYPHELSGGMGQRVMIAMMLAPGPSLLIADEPTSALDATVQTEILRLIEEMVSRNGMGLLLISHDLPLVSHFCDRVLVMYAGRIVEEISAANLKAATHPYTRALLECIPSLTQPRTRLTTMRRDPAWESP